MEEFLQRGSMAAQFARGAVKTGKAVSEAAKGAAVGGPYGAAAGALWEGRKKIGKVIAAMAALLLLPVLFLAMLPGLLYDGFLSWVSPSDPDTPVLNSSTAITENANNITFTINSILSEALEEMQAEMEADFASSGADCMEVVNPYAAGLVYNANLFASQYCAFRNDDYESVSIADMEDVLREGKGHLYSFRRREETRERTETDPETGEEEQISERWMVYTIFYNGEQYFADQVFHLTEEQRALAEDYAENMSLFLGDGLLQNLAGWDGNSIPSLGDVSFTDGATEVVYFNQLDERYAAQPYGTDYIGGYGCGPTCMAMVVSSLTEAYVEPTEMAAWAYENGYWCKGSGFYR